MESKVVRLRKYQVYDGDTLIGVMTSVEGEKLMGVSKRLFSERARDGGKLKNRYSVKLVEEKLEMSECRKNFCEEWRAATEVIREKISVEKIILSLWEVTVNPLRRKKNGIWKAKWHGGS